MSQHFAWSPFAPTSGEGGAILVDGASATLRACSFQDNTAESDGTGTPLNFFAGNGGAIAYTNGGGGLVDDCSFSGNRAIATIGDPAAPSATRPGSTSPSATPASSRTSPSPTSPSSRPACFTPAELPFLFPGVQEQIGGGAIGGGGGGSSLLLEKSSFVGNQSLAGRGGAVSVFGDAAAKIAYCRFRDNAAALEGGAVVNQEAPALVALGPTAPSTMAVTMCLFECNASGLDGGGIANLEGSRLTAANCTVVHNVALAGGGVANLGAFQPPPPNEGEPLPPPVPSLADLVNCILWENEADQVADDAVIDVQYSLVESGWPGKGNIADDPGFVVDDDEREGADYRLASGSPAIDAGDNWGVPRDTQDIDVDGMLGELMPLDLDGMPRFNADEADFDPGCGIPVVVDMGAYEYQFDPVEQILFADIDGNGVVDVDDLVGVIGAWGPCGEGCCIADLDLNDAVDVDDLIAVILWWN